MSGVTWLDNAKLRLSYGENGNQAIGAYATLPELSSNYYLNNDNTTAIGYYPSKLGDPSLGWETNRTFNFGLDFSILNRVLSGSLEVYTSRTLDLLLDRKLSSINGSDKIRQNVGAVANFGYEAQLSSNNVRTKDFSWSTDFTLAYSRNKILNVGLYDDDGNPIDDVANNWFIGKPIEVYYDYKFDHILQEHETPPPSQTNALPGWTLVHDLDTNGVLNSSDRTILGYRRPFYYAGLGNTLRYKNFTLSFFFNAQFGKIGQGDNNFWNLGRNTRKKDFWSPETPDVVYPKNDNTTSYVGVTIFDKRNNADFVRLQDVTLSYRFPEHTWMKRTRIKNLEVYANAKNVFLITNWAWGPDPEFANQDSPEYRETGMAFRNYPMGSFCRHTP